MADLSERDHDHSPDRDDVMLCAVKIDENGTLEVDDGNFDIVFGPV